MNQYRFTWKKEWVTKYISTWCIFERFKFANALSNNHILQIFGNEDVQKLKNVKNAGDYLRSLTSLIGIDRGKAFEIIGVDLFEKKSESIDTFKPILGSRGKVEYLTNNNISYCQKCMEKGFHSVFHQLTLFNNCVFHPNEELRETCFKCNKIFSIHDLCSDDRSSYLCQCGQSIMNNRNVAAIYKNWENEHVIQDPYILKFLDLHIVQPKLPDVKYPSRYNTEERVKAFNLLPSHNLMSYANSYYFDAPLDTDTFSKQHISKRKPQSIVVSRQMMKNYGNLFTYKFIEGSHNRHLEQDCIYYEIYEQSRHIYKSVRRYIKKHLLKNHSKCIHLNNELKESEDYCKFSLAFTYWREEYEDIQLSRVVRCSPPQSDVFNFERNKQRFTFFPVGPYCYYLANLLENIFGIDRSSDQKLDLNSLRNLLNALLPYLLLERFYENLDLVSNPHKYKSRNYILPNVIPLHLIFFEESIIEKTTIYHRNIYMHLKNTLAKLEKVPGACCFDKRKTYVSYISPEKRFLNTMFEKRFNG
ncbi:hypothetical protein [Psychrobacillus sp. L4]|uniref:hypothetical protein n=1 Tax=Psychrobacillus sp. L4 TaxID=3236892 RepID=UPI0036F1E72C